MGAVEAMTTSEAAELAMLTAEVARLERENKILRQGLLACGIVVVEGYREPKKVNKKNKLQKGGQE